MSMSSARSGNSPAHATPSSASMADYANSTRIPRTLTEREQRTLPKVTGEHRAGYRDHVLYAMWAWPRNVFAGHYYDPETELFENWHRYYDPSIGRYLQPEPMATDPLAISMAALRGVHLPTGYAANNPNAYVDVDGRNPLLLVAALIGIGLTWENCEETNLAVVHPAIGPVLGNLEGVALLSSGKYDKAADAFGVIGKSCGRPGKVPTLEAERQTTAPLRAVEAVHRRSCGLTPRVALPSGGP